MQQWSPALLLLSFLALWYYFTIVCIYFIAVIDSIRTLIKIYMIAGVWNPNKTSDRSPSTSSCTRTSKQQAWDEQNSPRDELNLPLLSRDDSWPTGILKAKHSFTMLLERPAHTIHYYWRKFDDAHMRPVFVTIGKQYVFLSCVYFGWVKIGQYKNSLDFGGLLKLDDISAPSMLMFSYVFITTQVSYFFVVFVSCTMWLYTRHFSGYLYFLLAILPNLCGVWHVLSD